MHLMKTVHMRILAVLCVSTGLLLLLVCVLYDVTKGKKYQCLLTRALESDGQLLKEIQNQKLRDEVTLVTAFIDIGNKGHNESYRPKSKYLEWMKKNGNLRNPIIAFFNTEEAYRVFEKARKPSLKHKTILRMVSTELLWSFTYKDNIEDILKKSTAMGYKHRRLERAYTAEYMCTMIAKYEFLQLVVSENPFHTKYIAWMDIAHLRNFKEENLTDYLYLPERFDSSKVAYQVLSHYRCASERSIFHQDVVWFGGQFFLSEIQVMSKWLTVYRSYIDYYISLDLMSTDEQILLAIYCHHFEVFRKHVQIYYAPNDFFEARSYVTHLCRLSGDKVLNQVRVYDVIQTTLPA